MGFEEKIKELTPRQREILRLVLSEKTNTQIAKSLFITVSTVEHSLKRIYRRLGVNGRKDLLG